VQSDEQDDDKDDDGGAHLEFMTDEQLAHAKVEMIDDEAYCNLSDLQQLADGTFVAGEGQYEYDLDTRTLRPIQDASVALQPADIQYIISGLEDDKGVPIENFDHFAAEVSCRRVQRSRHSVGKSFEARRVKDLVEDSEAFYVSITNFPRVIDLP
jgi:hypothetical protein